MQQAENHVRRIDLVEKLVPPSSPNPEVSEKTMRRKFSVEYKQRIIREAEQCDPGERGALLRREGLYSSHLAKWRRQYEQAGRDALEAKQRGRKPNDPLIQEIDKLRRENERLKKRLEQAEVLIDLQKKISAVLEIPLKMPGRNENE